MTKVEEMQIKTSEAMRIKRAKRDTVYERYALKLINGKIAKAAKRGCYATFININIRKYAPSCVVASLKSHGFEAHITKDKGQKIIKVSWERGVAVC